LAGHPYFAVCGLNVHRCPWDQKRWRVRWRDFYSMLQDAEFDSEQEARAFAKTVCKPPITVDDDEDCGMSVVEMDRYWRELASERATGGSA
jgi:hypothetical protein